ncbi:isoprenoid synthase domain-containing protein [Aspergillus caelatus]|uniref:Isoprenoid synthase domain-containing protein n=1 Tax=Aspergillus caelatus TaxID=61420 RepID=A0A5N7ALE7_9EURO|nr:isoprenoid synthase domain-containing protein [Aspergillus caelatus]KAE8369819.1 isoprenoid synthase domain-containing protein [Aspergillus caelatus]
MEQTLSNFEDDTSYRVERSAPDIEGFCHHYAMRQHKYEEKANLGSLQCRADWVKYIGPIERWGSCNPYEGHFGSVVLPLCKPERLAIISYIFEYAFLYDNVVESSAKATLNTHADNIGLDETEYRTVRSVSGTKQIQSKMMLELLSIDPVCAEVVLDAWKTMIATTAKHDKAKPFSNMEEYVDYRIIDTGAPFVDTLMRFGMGILLTEEEIKTVAPIVKHCYAALGLANDYFSFDVEWKEFQERDSDEGGMTNAVWLFMQWNNVDIATAKRLVREVTNQYEEEYQRRVEEFILGEGRNATKLHTYLRALAYQIPGNIAWSLRCPRYHPELCEKAGHLLEDEMSSEKATDVLSHPVDQERESNTSGSEKSPVWTADDNSSKRSSVSSIDSFAEEAELPKQEQLGTEVGRMAIYHSVREAFVDAMNVWLILPSDVVNRVKSIAETLHNASLMLDDIEDSSPLRRGQPAAHTIFGQGQTINSANYLLIQAMDQVRQLDNPSCMEVFVEEMRNLFIGQSFDLYWTRQGECPSQDEYLEMISQSGLFRLLARLMTEKASSHHNSTITLDSLVSLLGQYFQIRDDYKNLTEDYTTQKGFCEDLDEGKYSFPLVHALTTQPQNFRLRGILRESRNTEGMSLPLKQCVLEQLKQAGSMEHTHSILEKLMKDIMGEIGSLEQKTKCSNWVLRLLVTRLRV